MGIGVNNSEEKTLYGKLDTNKDGIINKKDELDPQIREALGITDDGNKSYTYSDVKSSDYKELSERLAPMLQKIEGKENPPMGLSGNETQESFISADNITKEMLSRHKDNAKDGDQETINGLTYTYGADGNVKMISDSKGHIIADISINGENGEVEQYCIGENVSVDQKGHISYSKAYFYNGSGKITESHTNNADGGYTHAFYNKQQNVDYEYFCTSDGNLVKTVVYEDDGKTPKKTIEATDTGWKTTKYNNGEITSEETLHDRANIYRVQDFINNIKAFDSSQIVSYSLNEYDSLRSVTVRSKNGKQAVIISINSGQDCRLEDGTKLNAETLNAALGITQ